MLRRNKKQKELDVWSVWGILHTQITEVITLNVARREFLNFFSFSSFCVMKEPTNAGSSFVCCFLPLEMTQNRWSIGRLWKRVQNEVHTEEKGLQTKESDGLWHYPHHPLPPNTDSKESHEPRYGSPNESTKPRTLVNVFHPFFCHCLIISNHPPTVACLKVQPAKGQSLCGHAQTFNTARASSAYLWNWKLRPNYSHLSFPHESAVGLIPQFNCIVQSFGYTQKRVIRKVHEFSTPK